MRRWARFLWERFPPLQYLPLIGALYAGAFVSAGGAWDAGTPAAAAALALVFLHLRLFDERKDYDHDRRFNPDRPLPRGLVTAGELRGAWVLAIAAELGLAAWVGPYALVAMGATVAWSILMLNEFWVRDWIRPRLYLYAVTHTLITPPMLLFVMSAETGRPPWAPPPGYLWFALAGWPLFLVFEVARKTHAPEAERPGVATYSSVHGPAGAAGLLAGQAVLVWLLHLAAMGPDARASLGLLLAAALGLLAASARYAVRPTEVAARHVRAAAVAFLIAACLAPVAAR